MLFSCLSHANKLREFSEMFLRKRCFESATGCSIFMCTNLALKWEHVLFLAQERQNLIVPKRTKVNQCIYYTLWHVRLFYINNGSNHCIMRKMSEVTNPQRIITQMSNSLQLYRTFKPVLAQSFNLMAHYCVVI